MKRRYKTKLSISLLSLFTLIIVCATGCSSNQNVSNELHEEHVGNIEDSGGSDLESRVEMTIENSDVTLSEDESTLYFYGEEDGKTYRYELNIYTGEKTQTEVKDPAE